MKPIAGAIVGVLVLAGCAGLNQQLAGQAASQADDLHAVAEWALCRAITVGAWVRAYGTDPAKAAAWRTLCSTAPAETPAK
jgi:outer membrane murein-binding lipoprotein Lpp